MKTSETSTNDIAQALKEAAKIVESAKVPQDLRTTAFERVLSELLSTEKSPDSPALGLGQHSAGEPVAALAKVLNVSVDHVVEVYQIQSDGTFSIHVPSGKLAKTKSSATRELALFVMAGRQASLEEWTDSDEIIPVVQHYGKYDVANNAKFMKEGDDNWQVRGSGRKRQFKLRKAGWEAAGELVTKIAKE